MNILDKVEPETLVFSIQDVDNVYEYVIVLKSLANELSLQMDIPAPAVGEYEDETGYYLIVKTKTAGASLNFMVLFIDALTDPELDIDLDHLQLFTGLIFVYQRFSNAKQQLMSNLMMNVFETVNELQNIEEVMFSLQQTIEYNSVPKLRDILNVMANAMEQNGIEVTQKINQAAKPVFH